MNEDDSEFLIGLSNTLMTAELIEKATVFMVALSIMPFDEVYECLESMEKEALVALLATLSLGIEVVPITDTESN